MLTNFILWALIASAATVTAWRVRERRRAATGGPMMGAGGYARVDGARVTLPAEWLSCDGVEMTMIALEEMSAPNRPRLILTLTPRTSSGNLPGPAKLAACCHTIASRVLPNTEALVLLIEVWAAQRDGLHRVARALRALDGMGWSSAHGECDWLYEDARLADSGDLGARDIVGKGIAQEE